MKKQPTYDELMALYLKTKREKEELEVKFLKSQKTIEEILKQVENTNVKLAKQLIDRFGIKSDKKEVVIGNEAEANATISLDSKAEKKKPGRKPGTRNANKFDLSKIEYIKEVVEKEDLKCKACGSDLIYVGDYSVIKFEYIPARFIMKEYIIKQYKCSKCNEEVEEKQINCFSNESFLTPSLGAFIVNSKYNYALPLYRLESMFTQLGAPLNRQLLSNYCINVASKLEVIYERLKYHLLNTDINLLHADETTIKVLEKRERSKCYIWLYATSMYDKPIYIYEYQDSREAKHPSLFLKDFNGYLVCDDYSGYEKIDNVSLCRCWFHAKKKYADFIKTLTQKQKESSKAVIIHNKISDIFHIESSYHDNNLTASEIHERREKEIRPLVDDYFKYIQEIYNNDVDKTSALGKAINYSLNIKDDLTRFFDDGRIPLTNNLSERAIKPFVILRKNCLFCNTQNGAEASAMLMSIVQTAKQNLVKPDEYIKFILERIDDIKTSELDSILPFSKTLPSYLKYKNNDIVD